MAKAMGTFHWSSLYYEYFLPKQEQKQLENLGSCLSRKSIIQENHQKVLLNISNKEKKPCNVIRNVVWVCLTIFGGWYLAL